jgi:hypothetical protein
LDESPDIISCFVTAGLFSAMNALAGFFGAGKPECRSSARHEAWSGKKKPVVVIIFERWTNA